ncbi:MAG: aspartate carbamoyltransferase [Deltaproteobacteria bacterium]|nr:MAG: aspartate carbamoyltransferase [Deltaproteobacteria bacterium]
MDKYAEQTRQEFEGWEEFYAKPVDEKLDFFKSDGRLFDIIYAQQFDREYLDYFCNLADMIRVMAKTKMGQKKLRHLLPHKRAMLYFVQPSTRTFLSFQNACYILGLSVSEIRGTTTSSEVKGESPEDTIRTFASYVNLIISRHPEAGFAEKMAWVLNQTERPVPVLNGGSGPDQHPTQALLDIYTLEREFSSVGGLDGKKIAMVGDLKRGRTVRSLSYLMKNYKDVTLYFVSPEIFKMKDDIKNFLDKHRIPFYETDDFEGIMPAVDAIYMTRIQNEYSEDPSSEAETHPQFHFKTKHLSMIHPHCVILHPLPRRYEIEVAVDNDPRAAYWRQERCGMWIRAALIAHIFKVGQEIFDEFS